MWKIHCQKTIQNFWDAILDAGKKENNAVQERHLLGIPLTHHNYGKGDSRHASPLRFVVKKQGNNFRGFILHLPHGHSSQQTLADNVDQQQVWEKVHRKLDGLTSLLSRATYQEVLS
jgi:hypothetical protein